MKFPQLSVFKTRSKDSKDSSCTKAQSHRKNLSGSKETTLASETGQADTSEQDIMYHGDETPKAHISHTREERDWPTRWDVHGLGLLSAELSIQV